MVFSFIRRPFRPPPGRAFYGRSTVVCYPHMLTETCFQITAMPVRAPIALEAFCFIPERTDPIAVWVLLDHIVRSLRSALPWGPFLLADPCTFAFASTMPPRLATRPPLAFPCGRRVGRRRERPGSVSDFRPASFEAFALLLASMGLISDRDEWCWQSGCMDI